MDCLIIQLHEHKVVAARFFAARAQVLLKGAAEFARGEESLPQIFEKIAGGISGAPRVILCLPPDSFAVRPVTLPLTDRRKVREVLSAHLQGETALPVENALFDAVRLADDRWLAIWARTDVIAAAIEQMKGAGIEPQVVTASPFAWHSIPGLPTDGLYSDGTAIALVRSGRLAFFRIASAGELPVAILGTLAALQAAGETIPKQLYLFGEAGTADFQELRQTLEEIITVDSLEMTPETAQLFSTRDAFRRLIGLCGVACAFQEGTLPDLRREQLAFTAGDANIRKKLIITAVLATLLALLLLAQAGTRIYTASRNLASLNASISSIYREIFPNRPKPVDELDEIKGELKRLKGPDLGGSAFIDVLRQLAGSRTAILGLYEAEWEGRNLRIKGDARSAQAVNEFKTAVAPLMATVEAGEIKTRPDGTVTFALWGTLREVSQ